MGRLARHLLHRKIVRVLLAVSLLTGCTMAPRSPERAVRLPDCPDWSLSGRIGVIQGGEGWHGGIEWRQTGPRFRVSLRGPLGQGGLLILGGPDRVRLLRGGSAPLEGADIDALVARALGWSVPVSGLRHWVLGRPAPDRQAAVFRDARGLPTRIEQDGWVLRYDGWTRDAEGLWWPARLRAERDGLRIKLAIRRHTCRAN